MNKIAQRVKRLTIQSVALFLASTGLATGIAQITFNSVAKADDFMNTYFRDGQVIKLVTPEGYNVNLPYATNGGMINTFEPDGTDDWKFVVIRTTNGVKFKKINTNHLITSQKFPSYNLAPLEAYNDVGGEDKYQTWIPIPSKPGYFNICLLAQQDQCMNVPRSTNRTKLTTYQRDFNDQDQWFSAVVLQQPGSGNQNPSGNTPSGQPDFNLSVYRQENPFWQSGFAPKSTNPPRYSMSNPNAKGNCTWYASGRAKQLGGDPARVNRLHSDATGWDNDASAAGIQMSRTPQVGAIAQWEYGHVAVVEQVYSDGTILISESSYSDTSGDTKDYLYKTERISASNPNIYILP